MFVPLKISVLCISDTRTIENDISGDLLVNKIAGRQVILCSIDLYVQDSIYAVRAIVSNWIADKECQVIITTGGTGVTGRDGTPEAVQPLFDKILRWIW